MLETVDRLVKCEKWIRDDEDRTEESKATWWLNRLIGRTKKVTVDWPFPFSENKLFVLTLSAGLEGYHITVDGRHVASFPYRTVSNYIFEPINLNLKMDLHSFLVVICNFNRALLLRMPLGFLWVETLKSTLYLLPLCLQHILVLPHSGISNFQPDGVPHHFLTLEWNCSLVCSQLEIILLSEWL